MRVFLVTLAMSIFLLPGFPQAEAASSSCAGWCGNSKADCGCFWACDHDPYNNCCDDFAEECPATAAFGSTICSSTTPLPSNTCTTLGVVPGCADNGTEWCYPLELLTNCVEDPEWCLPIP